MPDNFEVKYAKAQLKTSSEYVDQKTAEGNDPTPAAFRIVVLTKCRWFSMTFEGWNEIMLRISLMLDLELPEAQL